VRKACFSNDGLYCDGESGTCKERIPPGAGCSDDHACSSGRCRDGTCDSGGVEGSSCLPLGGGGCQLDLYCASSSGQCESIQGRGEPCHCASLKREGETCAQPHECAGGRCHDGRCSTAVPITSDELMIVCQ
jgi:hypothetical protein